MSTAVVSAADLAEPMVRRKVVMVRNAGAMTSSVECGEFGTFTLDEPTAHGGGGKGPSPLQGVLGCLCGCEAVTFNRTAAELDFSYTRIDFDAAFTIDIRGRMGVRSVGPHFQTVRVQATVCTDESEARLRSVVEETEARCPVFNLINDAGVKVEMLTEVEHWSLPTLRQKLVKIGAKVVRHGRHVTFPLAELAVPRELFRKILSLIDDLRPRPVPT